MNLPLEVSHEILSNISDLFPCRERQIHALNTLISINGAPTRNIIVHGLEATGKTATTKAVLEGLSKFYKSCNKKDNSVASIDIKNSGSNHTTRDIFRYAFVNNDECIDARQLFEHTIGSISEALDVVKDISGPLASLSDLLVQIEHLLDLWTKNEKHSCFTKRFILVFDGMDKQIRNGFLSQSVPAALARIGDFVANLTIIFITTCPRPSFLNFPGVPCIFFPSYTKSELLKIILLTEPDPALSSHENTLQIWSRFTAAVYDSLSRHSGRDILSFRSLCLRLWPVFIRPILSDELDANSFSRLMVANRSLFQNDYVLEHNIIASLSKDRAPSSNITTFNNLKERHTNIANLLPTYSRLLLIACYVASFSPARNDSLVFIKMSTVKRRRKGYGTVMKSSRSGVTKLRKIPRKLLGAQAFILERMLAIFHALCTDADLLIEIAEKNNCNKNIGIASCITINGSANIQTAIATLVSLRLLTRTGNPNTGDVLDASVKYRVMIGWDMARSLARSVGIEIENYLYE